MLTAIKAAQDEAQQRMEREAAERSQAEAEARSRLAHVLLDPAVGELFGSKDIRIEPGNSFACVKGELEGEDIDPYLAGVRIPIMLYTRLNSPFEVALCAYVNECSHEHITLLVASYPFKRDSYAAQIGKSLLSLVASTKTQVRDIEAHLNEIAYPNGDDAFAPHNFMRRCSEIESALNDLTFIPPSEREAIAGRVHKLKEQAEAAIEAERIEKERLAEEQRIQEQKEQEQKDAEFARVKELAEQYAARVDAVTAKAREWAERETSRLWKPWKAQRVSYTIRTENAEEVELARNIGLIRHQIVLAEGFIRSEEPVMAVDSEGKVATMYLGGIIDQKEALFDTPSVEVKLPYHRTTSFQSDLYAKQFFVNVPPLVDEDPAPFEPEALPNWNDVLKEHGFEHYSHLWNYDWRVLTGREEELPF